MAIFGVLSNQSGLSEGEIKGWRVDFEDRWYKKLKIEFLYEKEGILCEISSKKKGPVTFASLRLRKLWDF